MFGEKMDEFGNVHFPDKPRAHQGYGDRVSERATR